MRQSKGLSMIGLAARAGKVAGGAYCTEKEVRAGRAVMVIIARDASENAKKKFSDLCRHSHVPLYVYQDKTALGHATGKDIRASLAVLDTGFADEIRKYIEKEDLGDERRR